MREPETGQKPSRPSSQLGREKGPDERFQAIGRNLIFVAPFLPTQLDCSARMAKILRIFLYLIVLATC